MADGHRFSMAHGKGDGWGPLAKAVADGLAPLPNGANLGFIYASDALTGDLNSVLTFLRAKTGIAHWAGCVGLSVMAGGVEYTAADGPALTAMAGAFPAAAFRVFGPASNDIGEIDEAVMRWAGRQFSTFGLVHGDPENPRTPDLVAALAERTEGFLVGGLTSSRDVELQIADVVTGGGISGLLFASDVGVQTGLSQGCEPIGPVHLVTESQDNVVIALDGQPAVEVLQAEIDARFADDLSAIAGTIHGAVPVEGSDTGDFSVRVLTGVDPVRGWIAVGGALVPGDRLMFVRRDPKSAIRDMKSMLTGLSRRLSGPPRGGIFVSCVARGANMFGVPSVEMNLIKDAFGDIPIIGFAASGEISNNRLYGYTGVLTLFT